MDEKLLLTQKEIAERLGVSTRTVARAVAVGQLRPVKLFEGSKDYYQATDLARLLDGGDAGAAEPYGNRGLGQRAVAVTQRGSSSGPHPALRSGERLTAVTIDDSQRPALREVIG